MMSANWSWYKHRRLQEKHRQLSKDEILIPNETQIHLAVYTDGK